LLSWIFRLTHRVPWLLAGLVVVWLAGCHTRHPALPNEAYVWQRQWTPTLAQAVRKNADVVHGWRVLAAEMDGQGQWRIFAPDWSVLAATREPVVAVVRIEGQLAQWDEAALLAHAQDVMADWRTRGLVFGGVEIDHDGATARLPAYAHFLAALRPLLRPGERLSITALPTWLASVELDKVLAQVDEAVLQVHAVQSPRAGLFNAEQARVWLDDFARRMHKPWRVALPAYGTRVSWDTQGRVAAIESERPTLVNGDDASELFAEPSAMQAFVTSLDAGPPRGLVGIVWFRLPTDDDVRAWSAATWRAVLARTPLKISLLAQVGGRRDAALHDLLLFNAGNADVPLPSLVRLDTACNLADGINGFALQRTPRGLFLSRTQVGLLRAGQQLRIGWLRCQGPVAMHIETWSAR
jgi:hypothetical protein